MDASPEPEDMSLLDTDEYVSSSSIESTRILAELKQPMQVKNEGEFPDIILQAKKIKTRYLRVTLKMRAEEGFSQSYLNAKLTSGEQVKEKTFRMANAITKASKMNTYVFFVEVPKDFKEAELLVFVTSLAHYKGTVQQAKIEAIEPE